MNGRERAPHGVQHRRRRVQIHRVAELVLARRAAGLDAGVEIARVVPAGGAAADRSQEIPQRAIPEKVQRLVGDLEARVLALSALATGSVQLLRVGLAAEADVALFSKPFDQLLDQVVDLLALPLDALGRAVAGKEPLRHFVRQHAAIQQRIEDRIVQRLHRAVIVALRIVRIVEPAREQEIGQAGHQLVEVDVLREIRDEARVAVFHQL